MRLILTAVLILAASASALLQSSHPDLVITRVTVIDGEGTPPVERTVVVRGGTISEISTPETDVPDAAVTIDGRGKFLVPGLWDMHVHLSTRPEPQLAERIMLPAFLSYGIVGVRDMGGPLTRVLEIREQVNRGAIAGPRA